MPDAGRWNRIWYGSAASWPLRPLAWSFGAVAALRRAGYAAGLLPRTRVDCKVVVVGNLTVGGTGKTPLVIWLARRLRGQGIRTGIASRGYGAGNRQPRLVTDASSAADVGDEPLLLHRHAGAPVCVCTRRALAVQLLHASGCDLVLCDDGLQHYALHRDCEIVVIDGERGLGNGLLLPAGPLREGPARLRGVDFVVINGAATADLPALPRPALHMQLVGERLVPLLPGLPVRTLEELRGARVHAIAGIGNPQRFFALLRDRGLLPVEHAFPDHHVYAPADIRFADRLPVLMTEKDAVKCAQIADARHACLPVEARLDSHDARLLLQGVVGLLGSGGS